MLMSTSGVTTEIEKYLVLNYYRIDESLLPLAALYSFEVGGVLRKYQMEGEVTAGNLVRFVHDFKANKLKLRYRSFKSDDVHKQTPEGAAVLEVTGKNFEQIVADPSKDVFIFIYDNLDHTT